MKKHIIWQNTDLDIKDWEFEDEEEMTDYEKHERMVETNHHYLDDERANLNIQLDNPIIVIADLGLWNGRRTAYKIIESGNIKDILSDDADFIEWYSDGYNIRCKAIHHDGVNYYEYREIRNPENIHNLTNKLYNQIEVNRNYINRYTKSIAKHVNNVYGW